MKKHIFNQKTPLLMVMYASSVLVLISTFSTFPILYDNILKNNITNEFYNFLRWSVAIIGGAAFDIILTVTVFSDRKNTWSYATIFAALVTGLSIGLDLYLQLHLVFLHATYIIMGVLFALHLATNQGRNIKALEAEYEIEHNKAIELSGTVSELSRTTSELQGTITELQSTNIELSTKLENYTETMIEKLATKTDLTANDIVALIGGNRSKLLEKIKSYRIEVIKE